MELTCYYDSKVMCDYFTYYKCENSMIDTSYAQKKETNQLSYCETIEGCTSDCQAITEECEAHDNESNCKDDSTNVCNWEKKGNCTDGGLKLGKTEYLYWGCKYTPGTGTCNTKVIEE